jgi:hypothetical protein
MKFFKGLEEECLNREKLLSDSLKNESLKSKITKQPAPKVLASNNQEIQIHLNKEYYECRIKQLEDKLNERNSEIEYKNVAYDKLLTEFESFKRDSNLKVNGNKI